MSSVDPDLLAAAKRQIGREHGIPEGRAHRLVGATSAELHADAKALARELGVVDPTERARDDGGRFASAEDSNARINDAIRRAAGRAA